MLELAPWKDFGLAGMVIGALFLTIWMVGKSIILHLLNIQREERAEWRECFERTMTEHSQVIRELTEAVHETRGLAERPPLFGCPKDFITPDKREVKNG